MTHFVYTMTKFVTTSKLCHAFDKPCLHVHEFVCNIHQMTNFVYGRQTLSTVWQTVSTEVCLFESGPGLEGGGYLRAAQRPWCRLMGLLWEIFWLHGQVCLHYDKICLHMTNFVYSMTKFVYTYDTYDKLSAYDKLCLHHDKVCLHQSNFVMHLTNFVCITQINSVCHADDKVCHEVTHFFIPPTNIVCVLYTVYCVVCTV